MTKYATGNPVGSSDPRDLYDNAENLDQAVNSESTTFIDRTGKSRLTIKGMEQVFDGGQPAIDAYYGAVEEADRAELEANRSGLEADRAETAANNSAVNADLYDDIAAGIAGTSVGEQFQVLAASGDEYIRYRHDPEAVATEVGRFASSEILKLLGESSGSKSLGVILDVNGEVGFNFTSDGKIFAPGRARSITDIGIDSTEDNGNALATIKGKEGGSAFEIEGDGRLWSSSRGYFSENAVSPALGAAEDYAAFGHLEKAAFLRDKGKSELGFRSQFNAIGCRWNEDAGTNFARMPTSVAVTDTTGLLFFVQRRDLTGPLQSGERCTRLCVRNYTIDYDAETISFSSTTVLDEPPRWTDGLDKTFPCVPIKIKGGPNDGRIQIMYMVMRSDNGLQEGDYILDLYKMYSDDSGATWSERELVFDGRFPYGQFGVDPYVSGNRAGYAPGPGNCIVQIPADDPDHPGRIVMAAPLATSSAEWWQGVIYSDDYGVTWQHGQYTLSTGALYNESFIAYAPDRTLVLLLRTDAGRGSPPYQNTPGRGVLRSTDGGVNFVSEGFNETAAFNNCAGAYLRTSYKPKDGYPKMIAGGPSTIEARRNEYKFLLAYDEAGTNFIAESSPFPAVQGISYSAIERLNNGYFMLAYETFPGVDEFNTQSNVALMLINESALMHSSKLITE